MTGFLGAGKTSLLREWLKDPAFANSLVLVNEIGEVGLDQQMLAPDAGDPLLLENGCVCCSTSGDLSAILEQLFYDRLHRKIPAFERVIIETTGLAIPQSVISVLSESTLLRERYQAPFILTVVDVLRAEEQWTRNPESQAQIDAADLILITKSDLSIQSKTENLTLRLAREHPGIRVLIAARTTAVEVISELATKTTIWHDGKNRGAKEHSGDVSTCFVALLHDIQENALRSALYWLFQQSGVTVLRVKGCVKIAGTPQIVQADSQTISLEQPVRQPETFGLTIIAQGRPAAELAASLKAKLNHQRLARPAMRT